MKIAKINGVVQSCIDIDIGTGSIQISLPKTDEGAEHLSNWIMGKAPLSGHITEEVSLLEYVARPVTLGADLGPKAIVYGQADTNVKAEITLG